MLTISQIIARACEIAKCPGYTTQAGQYYNAVCQELAESYDLDIQKDSSFTITLGSVTTNSGGGPYPLPANYLRSAPGEWNYQIQGQPYILAQLSMAEWRSLFQGSSIQSYPERYATDFSTVESLGYPTAYFYPPPSGGYVVTAPYFKKHTDVTDPSTSTDEPWFPSATYLYTRIAAELMKSTDDTRKDDYIKESERILGKYLILKDDVQYRTKRVKLDPNYFPGFKNLPNTKLIGW